MEHSTPVKADLTWISWTNRRACTRGIYSRKYRGWSRILGSPVGRELLSPGIASQVPNWVLKQRLSLINAHVFQLFFSNIALERSIKIYLQTKGGWFVCVGVGRRHKSTWIWLENMVERSNSGVSQVPRPTFGSGSGLQCVYTVVISLWGTPAPTFLLEPPKTLFYWIPLCFRKPQAEFQKFSSTHGSPSDRFISSPRSPLLVGIKDEEYLSIWSLYFSVHVSFHFFVDHLP